MADESLESFVVRRLGREVLERIAEPLIAGIHAAEPSTMSLQASFPRFLEMEREASKPDPGRPVRRFKASSGQRLQLFRQLQGGDGRAARRLGRSLERR